MSHKAIVNKTFCLSSFRYTYDLHGYERNKSSLICSISNTDSCMILRYVTLNNPVARWICQCVTVQSYSRGTKGIFLLIKAVDIVMKRYQYVANVGDSLRVSTQ